MKSLLSLAAVVLLGVSNVEARSEYPAAALVYRQFKTLVYEGCYKSSDGLSKNATYLWNTKGYCQQQCAPIGKAVEATSNGNECWCGDSVPPSSAKVDDEKCNTICSGYGPEMCGADGYFSVYLTGTSTNVPNAASSDDPKPSPSPKTSATSSATPSVVTMKVQGQTVVVTESAQATATGSSQKKSSSSGPNKAAIAAGVVVGIVVIAAAAGGGFLYLRHRKRREVEEEYRRNAAVNSFVNGGKPPTSSNGTSFTDTRLDPTVIGQRRMSSGSIADDQDYSRRILKVTNA